MPGDTRAATGEHSSSGGGPKRIVIVGGGITGLAAAWELQRGAPTVEVTLIEATDRLGGKIRTEHVALPDGSRLVVEGGPDAFLTSKPAAVELARELGVADRLLGTNDAHRTVFVLKGGRPVPMPAGMNLAIPTRLRPFLRSPLLSPAGRARVLLDLVLPAGRDAADESLAGFVRRRLGREALESLAEPMMAGIYSADPERQSMAATFPRFREVEARGGSLIRGMRAARAPVPSNRTGLSVFASFIGGMQELPTALIRQLKADVRLNTRVVEIGSVGHEYCVALENGGSLRADVVILTVSARSAAGLLASLAPAAVPHLAALRTVSTGAVTLAYRDADIRAPLNGFGLVVPRQERRPINAITVASTKFTHRAPSGLTLLRIFFGGDRSPATLALDDADLLALVRREVANVMATAGPPVWHRIDRWPDANPQYDVGHLDRVAAIDATLPPGILVAGSPYRGVGLPDCIAQGRSAARRAIGGEASS